ncbi:MAG TPA: 2-amino-4-hydroxy-6-hydroxymethyldihydropteridine diphosphokinase [Xanthomonadales bacterium]|nr:2-amino-4-hydroxy-6-hydroxymethyldihydropteridine diphosphokinase [Xanthomonadales bacterium]
MRALVGLGSNQGDGPESIGKALLELARNESVRVGRVSSLYRTAPWGIEAQAEFTNAVAEIETELEPLELLSVLLRVEQQLGRIRNAVRWGPRVIDLDLLCCDQLQLHTPELDLPHPRMHQRAFVLVPLLELDPETNIPGVGSARHCLEKLGKSAVERLP